MKTQLKMDNRNTSQRTFKNYPNYKNSINDNSLNTRILKSLICAYSIFLYKFFLSIVTWITICLILICFALALKYFSRNYDYWKKRKVPYFPPVPFFGNFKEVALFKTSVNEWHGQMYEASKNLPYFGVYMFDQPYLLINSPELVKAVVIKDFHHFKDRSVYAPEHDVITENFMFWQPSKLGWKSTRSHISPLFSSGKLKAMFPLMDNVGREMGKYIREKYLGKVVDSKEIASRFTTDVISKCAFGIHAHSFKYEDPEIRAVGRRIFDFTFRNGLAQISQFFFPIIAKIFHLSFIGVDNIKFLSELFWTTIKQREKSGVEGNDLIDILVRIKKENLNEFAGDKLISQSVQFFVAGFETTGTTISFALYELCKNSVIQENLRNEVLNSIADHNGITYEGLLSMKYLDKCVKETLRKYPTVPILDRRCNTDYILPGTDLVIEKDIPVYVSLIGLHYDEQYFPDPYKFDPERFEDMGKINQNGLYYVPFGDGPRSCIGERFGVLVTKLALAHIVSKFIVQKTKDTPESVTFEKRSFFTQAKGGLPMTFEPYLRTS